MKKERSSALLPRGWERTWLKEVCRPAVKVKPQETPDKSFTYLDIASVDNSRWRIVFPKVYAGKDAPSRARQKVRSGNILFSTVRTYLKKVAMVPPEYDGQVASTGFCVLYPSDELDCKYVFYFVLSDEFISKLNPLQRGTSYPAVRDGDVLSQELLLPPLPEQHRIVAEIEKQFTRLDASEAALKRVQANLKRYRASVLKAACEGKLVPTEAELAQAEGRDYEPAGKLLERILAERRAYWENQGKKKSKYKEPVPPDTSGLPDLREGWMYSSIEPLLSLGRAGLKTGPFGSLLKKHEHRESGVPVFGIENIQGMEFVLGNKIFVTHEKAQSLSAYDVRAGDILISRSGTVGHSCVVPSGLGEARLSTNLIRLSLKGNYVLPQFISLSLSGSATVLDQISVLCGGSTRDFLNGKIIKSLAFPLPPLSEQSRIIDEVDRLISVLQSIEAMVETSLKRIERLRQSILKQAFTGQLVPQDPNDEPASALLERIKAEREAARLASASCPKSTRQKTKK